MPEPGEAQLRPAGVGGATPPQHAQKLQRLSLARDGGLNGLGWRWEAALAALDTGTDMTDADHTAVDNGTVRVRKAPDMSSRRPNPLQTAR